MVDVDDEVELEVDEVVGVEEVVEVVLVDVVELVVTVVKTTGVVDVDVVVSGVGNISIVDRVGTVPS